MRSFTKDFVAMALGMFFGALFAHKLGWFWPIGIVGGAGIGWIVRMLTEPKRIKEAALKSYEATINWRPKKDWKDRLKVGLFTTIILGGFFGVIAGLIAVSVFIFDAPNQGGITVAVTNCPEAYIVSFLNYLFSIIFVHLFIGIFCLHCEYHRLLEKSKPLSSLANLRECAYKYNILSLHYNGVKYFLFGIFWFLCQIPKVPSYFVWFVCQTWKCVKKIFWTVVLFIGRFLLFVHHERFTACGVYAGIGALIVFFVLPNQILLISIASIFCAIAGALLRPSVLALLEKKAVQV